MKFIVDVLMFLDFLVLAFSGFVLGFILPRGFGKFGFSFIFARETWLGIHEVTSIIIFALIIIHLLLNWVWIKCMVLGLFKKKKAECKV